MNEISFKFKNQSTADISLDIIVDDDLVEHFDKIQEDIFQCSGITYKIKKLFSNNEVTIVLSTDAEESYLDLFNVRISEADNTNPVLVIDKYMPTAPYTNTLSSVLFGLADNNNVIPLIDIENVDKFKNYKSDELIDFKHYLDLSSIKDTSNTEDRERIKYLRKQARKKKLGDIPELPPKQEEALNIKNKVAQFQSIEAKRKECLIPVYLWENTSNNLQDLEYFYTQLVTAGYRDFAIRVVDSNSFLGSIKKIQSINQSFIIFADMNTNFTSTYIREYLQKVYDYFHDIIYLGAHFLPAQMTIPPERTNKNHIYDCLPIIVYSQLQKDLPDLKYGDYCGFDRKTLSSMPKGGKPTARVVLCSLSNHNKVLIRRGWDSRDKVVSSQSGQIKFGMIHSMNQLLHDIHDNKLDSIDSIEFLNEQICDADKALKDYYPDRASQGEIKTMCLRHNIFSIVKNYIDEDKLLQI